MRAFVGVLIKEALDAGRDRRSLMAALSYVVAAPLTMALALTVTAREQETNAPITIAVEGAARAPALVRELRATIDVQSSDRPVAELVRRGAVPVALAVADDYDEQLAAGRTGVVRVIHDRGSARSRHALPRVLRVLSAHTRQITNARLITRGIAPQAVRSIDVQELDLSTPLSRAAPALATLPVFLVLAAFVTAMNLAIDVTAGERERRSLEALLVSPAPPRALVLGKWLVAAVVAAAGVGLTLAMARAVLHTDRIRALHVPVDLPWATLGTVLIILLPLALAVPAVQMFIAMFCRSYKEGQTYLSLLLFVPMVPGFLFAFDAVADYSWMAWTPLLSQQLAVATLIKGETVAVAPVIAAGALTVSLGLVALWQCVRMLGDERRVFAA
jgi:sodium transport system permease protein